MTNKADRGYVKFTGDYSKLKSMGFTFQKLFANNYMQWERDGFRVWKKGAELEHDEWKLFKLITFLESNPAVKTTTMRNGETATVFYKMYYDTPHNAHEYDYYPWDEEHVNIFKDYYQTVHEYCEDNSKLFPEPIGESICLYEKDLAVINEFKELGWYELDYYPEDK